jgi:hypothetical protein
MTRHVSDAVLDHWEVGATFYQGGYLDVVRRIGEKCKEAFHGWNVKTVVPFLDAVHHMLSTVQPREMGVTFDQKILNFNEWLLKERWRDRRFLLFRLMRKILATRAGRASYRRIASFLMPRLSRRRPTFESRGAET